MGARWVILGLAIAWALSGRPAGAQPPTKPPRPKPAFEFGPGDRLLTQQPDGVAGADFSPDGKWLAFVGADKAVRVWDVAAGKEVRRLDGHTGFVRTVAFSPDGKLLASAGDDSEVLLWDAATGKEVRRVGRHAGNLRMAVFSPDGKAVASAGFDEHIGVWDVTTGRQLVWFRAHPRVAYAVAFSPDGRTLASGGDKDGSVRLWDAATGKPVRS